MYDVRLYWSDGTPLIVKKLKDNLQEKLSNFGYKGLSQAEIFELHKKEHRCFCDELGSFVLPTWFISDDNNFLIIQQFLAPGLQYKDAIMKGSKLSESQLPSFSKRTAFRDGIVRIIEKSGILPDPDFFVVKKPSVREYEIVVFDTTGFYHEKREGRDRDSLLYKIETFLSL